MAETVTNNDDLGGGSGGKKQPPLSENANTAKRVAAYVMLPGIIPEVKNLLKTNFGYMAFLIAMIYQMVRILPKNHPYTRQQNIGRFTIRQVIAVAANHVKVDRHNIDQIIIFGAILAGMVLIIFQFLSLLFFLFSGGAFAQPIPNGLFETPNPDTDIAFIMIREVFGIPDFFGPLTGGPTGLHSALHLLFEFYNLAILIVAVLVFIYYIITVVGETATTGVPFGQRFSHIYAPFRLVIAIGLLVPLNYGFNGAQYLAFYAANLGSGFATQGWLRFNDQLAEAGSNPTGQDGSLLVAKPNTPDLTGLIGGMATILTCKEAYQTQGINITPYFINPLTGRAQGLQAAASGTYREIRDAHRTAGRKGHVSVHFGDVELDGDEVDASKVPLCGQIKIPIQLTDQETYGLTGNASPERVQEIYYELIHAMYYELGLLELLGRRIAYATSTNPVYQDTVCNIGISGGGEQSLPGNCFADTMPPADFKQLFIDRVHNQYLDPALDTFFEDVRSTIDFTISDEVRATGWGGAGIWYNSIAELNGAFTTVVLNPPNIEKHPRVGEEIIAVKQQSNASFTDCQIFDLELAGTEDISLENHADDEYIAKAIASSHRYWRCDPGNGASNFFWDTMIAVFGLNGLFNIYDDIEVEGSNGRISQSINPLAKLSVIGKGLVESSVQNLGLAMASSFGGGMLGILSNHLGAAAQSASSMFVSIATIGLSVGFILYYILPFLPFMYFFFALGGWVKGLFEAMVGTPLWALAHLRIDGDGLPGRSAMNGYLLIFEIFLRPILTVFGLIGGIAIFTALATILNQVFDIVVFNVTGTEINTGENEGGQQQVFGRHIVDEFFFTVVYAIILYMMATSSFKMITLVPNNILRWLGQSVSAFNDNAQDPTQGLTQYAAMGGARIGGQLGQAATQGSGALGQALKGGSDLVNPPAPTAGSGA